MRKDKSGAQELGETQMNAMEKRGLSPGVLGKHDFQLSSFQSKFTNFSGGLMVCKPWAWGKVGCIRHKISHPGICNLSGIQTLKTTIHRGCDLSFRFQKGILILLFSIT